MDSNQNRAMRLERKKQSELYIHPALEVESKNKVTPSSGRGNRDWSLRLPQWLGFGVRWWRRLKYTGENFRGGTPEILQKSHVLGSKLCDHRVRLRTPSREQLLRAWRAEQKVQRLHSAGKMMEIKSSQSRGILVPSLSDESQKMSCPRNIDHAPGRRAIT